MDVEFLDRMSQISKRVRGILEESENLKQRLAERIARRAEKAAEALIAETLAMPVIDGWLKEEGRPEIRRLLEAQRGKHDADHDAQPEARQHIAECSG